MMLHSCGSALCQSCTLSVQGRSNAAQGHEEKKRHRDCWTARLAISARQCDAHLEAAARGLASDGAADAAEQHGAAVRRPVAERPAAHAGDGRQGIALLPTCQCAHASAVWLVSRFYLACETLGWQLQARRAPPPWHCPREDVSCVIEFLSDLPSRTQRSRLTGSDSVKRPSTSPPAAAQSAATAAGGGTAGDGLSAGSRLHAIVTQHLRHQHRKACLRSAAPTTTLPPMSLLKRHELPQVRLSRCLHLMIPRPHLAPSWVPCSVGCRPAVA